MRKTIAAAAAALGLGAVILLNAPGITRAQAGPAAPAGVTVGRHPGGKRLQKLADALDLTDTQKAQIKPIIKDAAQQAKAVRQDTTLSPQDRKAKMKSIREGMRSQIMPLLTPDQKTKMAAMRHSRG